MHRAFRSPIIPALQNATRTRLYGTTTAQAQTNQQQAAANELSSKELSSSQVRTASPSLFGVFKNNNPKNQPRKNNNQTVNLHDKNDDIKILKEAIVNPSTVREFSDLVKVQEIMKLYRSSRDQNMANASDLLHAILSITKVRGKVLKPVISKLRRQIIEKQNVLLGQYLDEIVEDLILKRSYSSRFGLCYLLTSLNALGKNEAASSIWKKMNESSNSDLVEKVNDPRVIAALLHYSDPYVLSIAEVESLYNTTTKIHGRHMLTDEALAYAYINFGMFDLATKTYASICDTYNVSEWSSTIIRLHNHILTMCPIMAIAKVFFESSLAPKTFLRLHPSAATKYIINYYDDTKDINSTVDTFVRAITNLFAQSGTGSDPRNCINLVVETLKCIINKEFATVGPVEEAQRQIERVIEVTHRNPLYLNAVLSLVSKAWPNSEYIVELQNKYFSNTSELKFDTLRVLLNSCHYLSTEQCPKEKIEQWWKLLISMKTPRVFDWLSLAKACNNTDRVQFYLSQLNELKPTDLTINYSSTPVVKAAILFSGKVDFEEYDASNILYSNDTVDSEIKVRDVSV